MLHRLKERKGNIEDGSRCCEAFSVVGGGLFAWGGGLFSFSCAKSKSPVKPFKIHSILWK